MVPVARWVLCEVEFLNDEIKEKERSGGHGVGRPWGLRGGQVKGKVRSYIWKGVCGVGMQCRK